MSGASPPASQWTPSTRRTPATAALSVIVHAILASVGHLYLPANPVGVVAWVLSLTLPEVRPRTSAHPVAGEIPLSNADPTH